MPRVARMKCDNSIYHICARGNNKQDIFLDQQDREEYLKRLRRYKERYKVKIHAYCLMTNHVHLLIYDNNQDISKFMQGLSLSYVIYFNHKYGRSGHLFQDRFTSVMIKNDAYFLYVSKYIHLNPVKAHLVEEPKDYQWSSYKSYLLGKDELKIVDCSFLLKYFQNDLGRKEKLYAKYVENNMYEEVEEEIASTQEEAEKVNSEMKGIPHLSIKQAYKCLAKAWEIDTKKLKQLLYSYSFRKTSQIHAKKHLIGIYLIALLARLDYNQIAREIKISIRYAYKTIWAAVELMLSEPLICDEVDQIINDIKIN